MSNKVNINTVKILKQHGLGSSNNVQKHLASKVVELSAPYTPFQQGILQNSATISSDGSRITYPGPYAHYQYYGEVYGPNVETADGAPKGGKRPTGRKLAYNGAPMRGARWTERMFADKRKDLEKDVKTFIQRGK